MEIDLAALQVLLLALPGFVWMRFTTFIKGAPKADTGNEIISGLIFGTLTYLLMSLIYFSLGCRFDIAEFGTDQWRFRDCIDEVIFSIPIAIMFASFLLFLRGRSFPLALLRRLGVTNYSGDTDIWDYCFSEFRKNGSFVNVRDHEKGLIYQGFTQGYSERGDLRELLLTDVEVFNSDADSLYKASAVYLGRAPDTISIDFYEDEGTLSDEINQKWWSGAKQWWTFVKWW